MQIIWGSGMLGSVKTGLVPEPGNVPGIAISRNTPTVSDKTFMYACPGDDEREEWGRC